ncbi:hypothetical protein BDV93DRAFT_550050 [Ceratobasidium sp. AG-I]|nr:hypothetical protein BDV93DRAFT_550050 [Ceratobasidium sp. AG-I]
MCASFAHPVSYRLSALTAGHDSVLSCCEVRRVQVCFVGSSNQRQEPRRLGFMCVGGIVARSDVHRGGVGYAVQVMGAHADVNLLVILTGFVLLNHFFLSLAGFGQWIAVIQSIY